jgi:hypothetical protein
MNISDRDRRTLKLGGTALAAYLVLFYGLVGWKALENKRTEYQALQREAQAMEQRLEPFETKLLLIEKLRGTSGVDPSKLTRETVVALASADIQKVVKSSGLKLGSIRESPGSATARELAAMRMEAVGPVKSVVGLIHQLETIGYPLIIDSVEISMDKRKPGNLKLSMQVVILDFEQWKKERKKTRA